MRTESGSDELSMNLTQLGKYNASVTTALATWKRIEQIFHVSDKHIKPLCNYNVYDKKRIKTRQEGQYISLEDISPVEDDLTVIALF